jgi:cytochrome b6-f complex iron-sulfur subunit
MNQPARFSHIYRLIMTSQPTSESISRAAFLRSLGLSAATLSALYFSACSKGTTNMAPASPTDGTDSPAVAVGKTDPAGPVDFTLDLTLPDNAKLKTIGQFATAGLIVVAHTKDDRYVALLSVCTHASGSLWYQASQDDFRCLDHGGLFHTDGSVKGPPPTKPVKTYTVTLSADKNTLHVTG